MTLKAHAWFHICETHKADFWKSFPEAAWYQSGSSNPNLPCDVVVDEKPCNGQPTEECGIVIADPASMFAARGGSARSEAKAASSRDNGKKGGRPRGFSWYLVQNGTADRLDSEPPKRPSLIEHWHRVATTDNVVLVLARDLQTASYCGVQLMKGSIKKEKMPVDGLAYKVEAIDGRQIEVD